MGIEITVNEKVESTDAASDTPLLYVLRDDLQLRGPKFGCGLSQCGACSVLLDGKEIRSCVTPVAAVVGKRVTTLEGLPALVCASRSISPSRRRCIRCSRRGSTSRFRSVATARTE